MCGSQGQSIHKLFIQKSTDIDSPFTCVKNSVERHLDSEKGTLKLIQI